MDLVKQVTKLAECKLWSPRRIAAWLSIAAMLAAFVRYVLPSLIFAILMLAGGVETRQLERLESPDHFARAVVVQTSAGLEPPGLHVYVERANAKKLVDKPVLEGIELLDLKLIWLAPKLLQISYSSGCIDLFQNNWLALNSDGRPHLDQDGHPYSVEVRLKPPSDLSPHTCD